MLAISRNGYEERLSEVEGKGKCDNFCISGIFIWKGTCKIVSESTSVKGFSLRCDSWLYAVRRSSKRSRRSIDSDLG